MNFKSIIFVTNGIFPHVIGGMQRHSRLLIEELAKNNELQIFVIHPHNTVVFEGRFKNISEIPVSPIDTKQNYLLEYYKYSRRVHNKISELPIDIPIYSQGYGIWYGITKFRKRLFYNPHGLESFQTISCKDYVKMAPHRFICDYLINQSFKVLSLGGKLTNILSKRLFDKSKLIVIPNAVTKSKYELDNCLSNKFNKKQLNCFFVARFASNKGIHILIEAIRQLNLEGFEEVIYFNLAGTGPLYETYKNKFNFENVNYLGNVDDEKLEELYLKNDLFVFPTLFEGMPTVILEAMSFGMPIISTNVGAVSELVNVNNGYLIEANDVFLLKNAILDFKKLPLDKKKEMSSNSYRIVNSNFTWEKVANKTIYEINSTWDFSN